MSRKIEVSPAALSEAMMSLRARRAVDGIVHDLSDRRGLKQEWHQIAPEIQRDIRRTWQATILEAMKIGNADMGRKSNG